MVDTYSKDDIYHPYLFPKCVYVFDSADFCPNTYHRRQFPILYRLKFAKYILTKMTL